MNKKNIVYLFIITIFLIVLFIVFNKCTRIIFDDDSIKTDNKVKNEEILKYDLNEAPIKYGIDTLKGEKEYFKYLKQYIKPNKLLNFISEKDLFWPDLYNKSGVKMLEKLKSEAYQHLFESMFDINRTDFNDCAVTENFIEKFNTNLNSYFDIGGEDCNIEVYTDDRTIKYKKWWNLGPDGDPANGWLYVFKYTLDEEGNVDDIVLDYTTGDF